MIIERHHPPINQDEVIVKQNMKFRINEYGHLEKVFLRYSGEIVFEPVRCIHVIDHIDEDRYSDSAHRSHTPFYKPVYEPCSTKCIFFGEPEENMINRSVKLKLCSGELNFKKGEFADFRDLSHHVEEHFGKFWVEHGDTFQKCNIYINGSIEPYGDVYMYGPEYHSYGGDKEFWLSVKEKEFDKKESWL